MISVNQSERPIFFPLQNVSQNHFYKIGKFKKFHRGKIKILKKKDELMANICHFLVALLP